ncbi:MAG TPA: hypothetical protein GX714_06830 [Chloroflexi bacterium]|jgi:hypothetical protein|nr:hypothetical protein [Chloroflexota bacterium]
MWTLSAFVAAVAAALRDPTHAVWSEDEVVDHLRSALGDWSRAMPRRLAAVLPAEAGRREYDLTALDGLIEVTDVWYPYDAADTARAPIRPAWSVPRDGVLRIETGEASRESANASLRVFYAAAHTIEGLDGAVATTLDAQGKEMVVLVASAHAAMQAAQSSIGTVTVTGWTPKQYAEWAILRLEAYRRALEDVYRRAAGGDARVVWG